MLLKSLDKFRKMKVNHTQYAQIYRLISVASRIKMYFLIAPEKRA